LHGGQWMAKVQKLNDVETLPKSTGRAGSTNVTDDRQTDQH